MRVVCRIGVFDGLGGCRLEHRKMMVMVTGHCEVKVRMKKTPGMEELMLLGR